MKLIRTGYFREMPHGEENDPSIKEAMNGLKLDQDTERIIDYLDAGKTLVVCCGSSIDVVDPEKGISGTPSMLTDGVWVWPGDLSYYVRNYHVAIDAAFVEHMRSNNWAIDSIPINVNQEEIEFVGTKL